MFSNNISIIVTQKSEKFKISAPFCTQNDQTNPKNLSAVADELFEYV